MSWTTTENEYRYTGQINNQPILLARINHANHAWYAYAFPIAQPTQQNAFATLKQAKAWAEEQVR